MISNKKLIVTCSLVLLLCVLVLGTVAYFRRTVNGNITGQAGNLVLIVNEKNAELNETFTISLNDSVEYVMPGDKGVVNLNIDSTGSVGDVHIKIKVERTNLPDNLNFYLDKNYENKLSNYGTVIKRSADMSITIPIYWYWENLEESNDNEFINTEIEATINIEARLMQDIIQNSFHNQLLSKAELDTNVDFRYIASDTNGQGLMMMDSTQNDEYPILYYRGDVADNNVIYAGFCWLIVRTTETGGVKLIYNGEINDDGSCTNYSGVGGEEANSNYFGAYINQTPYEFNSSYDSPVYAGYMYNDTNQYYNSSNKTFDANGYIAHLANDLLDQKTGRYVQNKYDSTIKGVIDDWYEDNILNTDAENLLEDTVWCNDRSVTSTTYNVANYSENNKFYFSPYTRFEEPIRDSSWNYILPEAIVPSLSCAREIDKFTVSTSNGNGDLDYPIGLITADELHLAGILYTEDASLQITYLSDMNYGYWTLSPGQFIKAAYNYFVAAVYMTEYVVEVFGVRPSVSLGLNATLSEGDGSFEKPYIIGS